MPLADPRCFIFASPAVTKEKTFARGNDEGRGPLRLRQGRKRTGQERPPFFHLRTLPPSTPMVCAVMYED